MTDSTRKPAPVLIGIAGGNSCGKKALCEMIMEGLRQQNYGHRVGLLSMDSFYKPLNAQQRELVQRGLFNFDHPDAFDFDAFERALLTLKQNQPIRVPQYDLKSRSLTPQTLTLQPLDVILIEGILTLHQPQIIQLLNMKIFIDVDSDIRLSRRVQYLTDSEKGLGRDFGAVLEEYCKFVKPSFEEFVQPTKKRADLVIPNGYENIKACDLIVQHIVDLLSHGIGTGTGSDVLRKNGVVSDVVLSAKLVDDEPMSRPRSGSAFKDLLP